MNITVCKRNHNDIRLFLVIFSVITGMYALSLSFL